MWRLSGKVADDHTYRSSGSGGRIAALRSRLASRPTEHGEHVVAPAITTPADVNRVGHDTATVSPLVAPARASERREEAVAIRDRGDDPWNDLLLPPAGDMGGITALSPDRRLYAATVRLVIT